MVVFVLSASAIALAPSSPIEHAFKLMVVIFSSVLR